VRLFAVLIYFQIAVFSASLAVFEVIDFSPSPSISISSTQPWLPIIYVSLCVVSLIVGIALWRLKNWARRFTIGISIIGAILGPLLIIAEVAFQLGFFELLVSVASLWLFLRTPTRNLFLESKVISKDSLIYQAGQQNVALTTCPQCKKRTSGNLRYCAYCGSDIVVPTTEDKIRQIISRVGNGYKLKSNSISEFNKGQIDEEAFNEVYVEYSGRLEKVEKALRDFAEKALAESIELDDKVNNIRKKANVIKLRLAVGEISKGKMSQDLDLLNRNLPGIYGRQQNIIKNITSISKIYSRDPPIGSVVKLISSLFDSKEKLKLSVRSVDTRLFIENDMRNIEKILTYFGEELPKRLVTTNLLTFCTTCGKELKLGETCKDCTTTEEEKPKNKKK
jgi:hypothetical protein